MSSAVSTAPREETSPTRADSRPPRKRKRTLRTRTVHARIFGVLGLPALALYLFAVLIPLFLAIRYSLLDFNLLTSKGPFVGLENYVTILTDGEFWRALSFTLVLTAVSLVVANAAGVALAVVLNRPRRFFNILRAIAFVPAILSGVVLAYIWSTILTDRGVLNSVLGQLGLSALQTSFLGTQTAAQISVIAVSIWPTIGFTTVIYLAGLQGIPTELNEAASIDGAGPSRTFWSVTWPLLRPSLFIVSTMIVIGGVKSYDISVILTGGGPVGATETPAMQILRQGLTENNPGPANAEAIILLIIIVVISLAGFALNRKGDVD
ncbi:hypothetical protein CSIV_01580 [Microbacterium sp. CSI-V]|uniref:carbohydrate ABC transporter permease n=1 Tax=unclassified Microbacterium TaxID=2609290 RepID=UPI00097C9A8C|nr:MULTISPECIES: sugar ABC transporter permease [unclassified Microbacterium]MXS75317.1 sugar ABC transporter permease [Microbacterium sp. TL13]ONI66339.1 hypothetical protein CSIV_01580 [Microbacterium sp. CSI-V]